MESLEYGHDQYWVTWMYPCISFSSWYDSWFPLLSSCWSSWSAIGCYVLNQRFDTCLRSSSSSHSFLSRCSSEDACLALLRTTTLMLQCSCLSRKVLVSYLVLFWNPMWGWKGYSSHRLWRLSGDCSPFKYPIFFQSRYLCRS